MILIQENRSFDHYFGTYRGVRGFADRHGRAAFAQHGYTQPGQGVRLRPFHLETHGQAQCTTWRRSVTGDLTSAFSFARPDRSVPRLPRVNVPSDSSGASQEPYRVPANHMPGQEHGRPRRPRHS